MASGMQGFMHKPILKKRFAQSLFELGLLDQEAISALSPIQDKAGSSNETKNSKPSAK